MNTSNASALKGNLKTLVATGGVFAGGSLLSQAAIIYTDIIPDLTYTPGSSSIFFSLDSGVAQLNGSGDQNLQFKLYSAGTQTPTVGSGYFNMTSPSIAYFNASGRFASKLSGGAVINVSRSFSDYGFMAKNTAGQWAPDGTHGYLGLEFNAGPGNRFGWAEVSYNANQSVTLYSFAYDDTGGSINAGQIAAVPEPAATGAIAAVLAGSVAAFDVRRRRKAAKQAQVQPEPMAACS